MALKSVDLPTFGSPTIPQRMAIRLSRAAVQLGHGALRALLDEDRHAVGRRAHRLEDEILFGARRARQHVIDHLGLVAGMPDAEPQAPEILADVRDDVAQPVVAAVTAAVLQAHGADRQIELIVRHQDLLGRDLEEIAQLPHRQAAAVHVRGGLQQHDVLAADVDARGLAGELAVVAKLRAVPPRKQIHEPETRVVAGDQMLGPRIAETGDDPQR